MTPEEQLELWVAGESVYNETTDECCPDFSCCNPKINTPIETKKRFQKAFLKGQDDVFMPILMMFLSEAIAKEKLGNVHVAGFVDD